MSEWKMGDRRVFVQWVRATWVGWLLGVPLIIALALIGDAVGIGGSQALVGAGMGAGLGFMQGRAIRGALERFAPWFWSWGVGLAIPFLAWDIARAAGWEYTYSLYLSVALGGLLVGVWQAFILRTRFRNSGWWVVMTVAGCGLASGTAAVADILFRTRSIRGIWGALAYLAVIVMGGLVLGLVTGIALVWMLRDRQPSDSPSDG